MIKKYLIFAYDDHYPDGGVCDFYKSVDSLDEAQEIAESLTFDNIDIVEHSTMKLIKSIDVYELNRQKAIKNGLR